jgi:hypothetical protein
VQTKKQWLMANGHISEIKRGRVSRDHEALIQKAVAAGAKIEGYSASSKDSETVVTKDIQPETGVAELAPYRFTEEEYKAVEFRNGKKVERSLRSACNLCRVSLVVCYCPEPRIVAHDGGGSVRVYIERR